MLLLSHSVDTSGTEETIHYEMESLQTWVVIYLLLTCEL